jgi:urease accessory protein
MIAHLDIIVAKREQASYLRHSYFTTPFKLANITVDKQTEPLQLVWMSSSPGMLEGDCYHINIELEADTALHLQTQAYQRLYQMKTGAVQTLNVQLHAGASFQFIPHPCVPHEGAIYKNVATYQLAENCQLIIGEILTCGRKLNGEVFRFQRYHSLVEIWQNNLLIVRENMLMEPATMPMQSLGLLEGFTHQASLLLIHPTADMATIQLQLLAHLSKQIGVDAGVSKLAVNGLVVRILGNGAEILFDQLQQLVNYGG